jgi:alkylated DNA repair dioxygenase AlkB
MMSSQPVLAMRQRSLFGPEETTFDPALAGIARTDLGAGAWIEHLLEWVRGHEHVLEVLWTTTRWEAHRRRMYERVVDVPRLVASLPEDGPGHPVVSALAEALGARYGRPMVRVSLAAYRDGRDSVAFHGDRLGPARADAIVAIVGLGSRRRFLLRPAGGGRSRSFDLGGGDLLVMGGTCQQTWEHGIPKVAHADLRISIQFRSAPTERLVGYSSAQPKGAPAAVAGEDSAPGNLTQ